MIDVLIIDHNAPFRPAADRGVGTPLVVENIIAAMENDAAGPEIRIRGRQTV
jgi:hypothetical protein